MSSLVCFLSCLSVYEMFLVDAKPIVFNLIVMNQNGCAIVTYTTLNMTVYKDHRRIYTAIIKSLWPA